MDLDVVEDLALVLVVVLVLLRVRCQDCSDPPCRCVMLVICAGRPGDVDGQPLQSLRSSADLVGLSMEFIQRHHGSASVAALSHHHWDAGFGGGKHGGALCMVCACG